MASHPIVKAMITAILLFTLLVACQTRTHQGTKEPNSTQTSLAQATEETSNKTIIYGELKIEEKSDYIMIPVTLSENSDNKDSLFRNPSSYEYDRKEFFDNLIFYRKQDGTSHLLLNKPAKITSFETLEKKEAGKPSTYFFLYKIIEADTNADKKIGYEDATIGYLSDLSGKNLQQITPNNAQMLNWVIVQSIKSMFVKIIKDSNRDQKFTEIDETTYIKVNLDSPSIGTEIISDDMKKQIKSIGK
ncbi:MAG TPA: hypothetical protein DEG17_02355 [Cyanobacteria bacterium UBA11149]|nr:hypothetical protein [Cyanobacteria bacterium UBA11367]HBE58487.1 hypothetical protein [Cyanobacteria bacterium UBA11366]HBK65013.1 hypothetical protein [Cyanobacteria bacterium UBA11166]HBR75014.1 hypothetical protein [Cyanobacteria bacterium UBA11159]HBS68867.1 hypothetical protein [Cyanobacteria bacterium UBA11153]HBW87748.1 hypothetical protein [Cyanobacteria bacterium UBA11149]HCA98057.1 hypothetical protein [Cyanobacteria bacterium UBA9226]